MLSFDQYLPGHEFSAAYSVGIAAPAERIFTAIKTADFSQAWIVRATFYMRGLPRRRLSVDGFVAAGQCKLVYEEPREILLGFSGRPWQTKNVWRPGSPAEFLDFQEPDYVRIVWGFRIQPPARTGDPSRLITETRVQPTDPGARAKFAAYWRWIAPFSGMVRRAMLNEIRSVALADS